MECKLKTIFAERDIKQRDFAERVGISPSTLSQLKKNKQLPTLEVAYRIAEELELSVEEIWIRKEPSN